MRSFLPVERQFLHWEGIGGWTGGVVGAQGVRISYRVPEVQPRCWWLRFRLEKCRWSAGTMADLSEVGGAW